MTHRHARAAHAVGDRALKAGLFGVGPVDVLLMPVAHHAVHERPVVAVGFLVSEVGFAIGVIDSVLRRKLAAPTAVIDAAVVGINRAQVRAVGGIRLAHLLRERAATLAAVPNGLLGHIGLNVVRHLERRMEMHVDAVMQRTGIVEAVVERRRHFLVHGQRHGEDRENLQIGIFRVVLVDVFQVNATVPASTASERANLQIFEGVVTHEGPEGLTYDLS